MTSTVVDHVFSLTMNEISVYCVKVTLFVMAGIFMQVTMRQQIICIKNTT